VPNGRARPTPSRGFGAGAQTTTSTFGASSGRRARDEPDFSPLDFPQRYTGVLGDGGATIVGAWEICHDGQSWEHDFDLTYTRQT
jgi:hypothetical protein